MAKKNKVFLIKYIVVSRLVDQKIEREREKNEKWIMICRLRFGTAMRILERLGIQTSSSFVKI